MNRIRRTALAGMIVGGALLAVAGPVAAAPPDNGCARGFERWDITTDPYMVDGFVDEDGNDNGWVCARAVGNQYFEDATGQEFQIYVFADDTLPASENAGH